MTCGGQVPQTEAPLSAAPALDRGPNPDPREPAWRARIIAEAGSGGAAVLVLGRAGRAALRLHYRRGGRTSAKVRAFGDFVTEVFERLEASRGEGVPPEPGAVPDWYRAGHVGGLAGRWKPRPRKGRAG